MKPVLIIVVAAAGLMIAPSFSTADDNVAAPIQGVWIAQSMEADGKPAPAEAIRRMQFHFQGSKLLIRGNSDNDQEEECDYKIDPKQSPHHLDFTPPKANKPILAIYDVKGDEMKICMRHASSADGRPTEFATKADSKLVLIVFTKQKP